VPLGGSQTGTVWGPLLGTETGLNDAVWVNAVRRKLRDLPKWLQETRAADGTNGSATPPAIPYQVARPPINDGSFSLTLAGTSQTITTTYPPAAGEVYVDYDTGEIYFGTIPPSPDAMVWNYQQVKWRDQEIMDGLYAGLREMFPAVGKVYTDVATQIQVLQWDYQLPPAATDPRSKILYLEGRDPNITVLPFEEEGRYKRIGTDILHLYPAMAYSPAANLRVTYWGPFQTLADMEPSLFWLPVWYCLSSLLPWAEAPRVRDDRAVPSQQEGGQQPGVQIQTGDYYYKRFTQALQNLKTQPPGQSMRRFVSVYQLNHLGYGNRS